METSDLSEHQLRVFSFVRNAGTWVTAAEIAAGAGVAPRTARSHALSFVRDGLFERAEIFPGHRYRLSPLAEKNNAPLVRRIERAFSIVGGAAAASARSTS